MMSRREERAIRFDYGESQIYSLTFTIGCEGLAVYAKYTFGETNCVKIEHEIYKHKLG